MSLRILYRGPLSSCNYGCEYCPFAKRKETRDELAHDRACFERFVDWVAARDHEPLGILITPWGEALIRRWYQEGMARMSHMAHVERIAIQTNLSCKLDWIENADLETLALWCTWHPEWTPREAFVQKAMRLREMGVRFSVGTVGFARFRDDIQALRDDLPDGVYLWINAVKKALPGLDPEVRAHFSAIDPLYELNTRHYDSRGKACRAGATAISVDGDGNARRCHFIPTPIGNIYAPDFESALKERPCTNATCHCHIGYVHMDGLGLDRVFGDGILERIPVGDWKEARP